MEHYQNIFLWFYNQALIDHLAKKYIWKIKQIIVPFHIRVVFLEAEYVTLLFNSVIQV